MSFSHTDASRHEKAASCSKCHMGPAQASHTCPYQREINDDDKTECDCCQDCMQECCDDI